MPVLTCGPELLANLEIGVDVGQEDLVGVVEVNLPRAKSMKLKRSQCMKQHPNGLQRRSELSDEWQIRSGLSQVEDEISRKTTQKACLTRMQVTVVIGREG